MRFKKGEQGIPFYVGSFGLVSGTRAGRGGALRSSIKVGTCLKSKSLFVARIEAPFAAIRAMLSAWLPQAAGTSLDKAEEQPEAGQKCHRNVSDCLGAWGDEPRSGYP